MPRPRQEKELIRELMIAKARELWVSIVVDGDRPMTDRLDDADMAADRFLSRWAKEDGE